MIIALDTMEKLLPGEKGREYPAKKKVGGPEGRDMGGMQGKGKRFGNEGMVI